MAITIQTKHLIFRPINFDFKSTLYIGAFYQALDLKERKKFVAYAKAIIKLEEFKNFCNLFLKVFQGN